MRHFRRPLGLEAIDRLLPRAVGLRDPLVLAQMLHPGIQQERLQEPSGLGGVLVEIPLERAVAPPLRREPHDGIHERAAIGRIDVIFDRHQDRAAIGLDVMRLHGLRPMHGGREVDAGSRLQLPAPKQRNNQ
jgi:hypothetical protein